MAALTRAQAYKLGDPREQETTLGPVISLRSAANIREHIKEAGTSLHSPSLVLNLSHTSYALIVSQGARALISESDFPEAKERTTYVAPQVLIDVDHSMKVMSEETFGPVVGIMKVRSAIFIVRFRPSKPRTKRSFSFRTGQIG